MRLVGCYFLAQFLEVDLPVVDCALEHGASSEDVVEGIAGELVIFASILRF